MRTRLHRIPRMKCDKTNHITANEVKRVIQWRGKSAYILRSLTKYIIGDNPNRGMLLEAIIVQVLCDNNYNVQHINSMWIHKHVPWLSCTTDGIIMHEDRFVAVVEIKTFTSVSSLRRTLNITDKGTSVNKNSRANYQMQTVAEIVHVPYVVLVYEYESWYTS